MLDADTGFEPGTVGQQVCCATTEPSHFKTYPGWPGGGGDVKEELEEGTDSSEEAPGRRHGRHLLRHHLSRRLCW